MPAKRAAALPLPATGAVTFLFTDIEGSTRLWETEPVRMAPALARHDALCRGIVAAHGGRLVKMTGDGMLATFDDPSLAVAAALELQLGVRAIAADAGLALRMRSGLHAGVSQARDGDYFGPAVNRAARIMSAAHGGQILLSQAVVDEVKGRTGQGIDLLHLGRVRLRDLSGPEDVWQLLHGDLQRAFPPLRSLDATPNNLPQQVTSFIGREKEIAEIEALLAATRLLTLTGSGGCGKTRLSLEVAADALESSTDGVWFVELAALADPALVPQAVASVLGLREERDASLTQILVDHVRSRHLLLVLDNCEHVLAACATLADAILTQCPHAVLLATSRQRLGLPGERVYRVPSLSTPDPKRDVTPETLSRYESARLFRERAQLQQPRFVVNEQNARAVASVCHRLDGIPLAIELAEARMRSMPVEEIDHHLDRRFMLLTGGSRAARPRQQTLRAMIDWSYDLLEPAEQALYGRLAVFAGGFSADSAERVGAGEPLEQWQVLHILTSLADRNLVAAEERDGANRYRLLETIRQHALERLRVSGDGDAMRRKHRDYFLALAEEAEPKLRGAEQAASLRRLEEEHENLRAAFEWCVADEELNPGLRFCGALQHFWTLRGHVSEGREWCARMLPASAKPTRERAKALSAAGALAYLQADYGAAKALHEESLAIRRQLGDQRGIATSLSNLGVLACDLVDFASARALFEESLAILRQLDDAWGIAIALGNLGRAANELGDYDTAKSRHEESLAIKRELGNRAGIANTLHSLANVAHAQGELATAKALHLESIEVARELGHRPGLSTYLTNLASVVSDQGEFVAAREIYAEGLAILIELGDRRNIAVALEGLAVITATIEGPSHAARIFGAAQRLREDIGSALTQLYKARYDARVAAARAAMRDDALFDRAWQEGRALTLEQAIALALART
jgi:predicted ATPase/class 3 adenylate cyclase